MKSSSKSWPISSLSPCSYLKASCQTSNSFLTSAHLAGDSSEAKNVALFFRIFFGIEYCFLFNNDYQPIEIL